MPRHKFLNKWQLIATNRNNLEKICLIDKIRSPWVLVPFGNCELFWSCKNLAICQTNLDVFTLITPKEKGGTYDRRNGSPQKKAIEEALKVLGYATRSHP